MIKFSPDGKVLMTIGRAGGATGPTECCWQPNDVITNAAGEIFVAEGHGTNPNDRIIKRYFTAYRYAVKLRFAPMP